MLTKLEIKAAAKAIHAYELERGYITGEWGQDGDEPVYLAMAKAALRAAQDCKKKRLPRVDLVDDLIGIRRK